MNTPNKLTLLRIILVPFFVAALLLSSLFANYLWATLLFAAASITDCIDGNLARKYNLVTDFGKFLDPLADKILVVSALVCFVQIGLANAVVVVIILAREFLVTSLRLVAAGKGTVIAASKWGKLKTVSQMAAIVIILVMQAFMQLFGVLNPVAAWVIGDALLWIAALFTILSGIDYIWVNRHFVKDAV